MTLQACERVPRAGRLEATDRAGQRKDELGEGRLVKADEGVKNLATMPGNSDCAPCSSSLSTLRVRLALGNRSLPRFSRPGAGPLEAWVADPASARQDLVTKAFDVAARHGE